MSRLARRLGARVVRAAVGLWHSSRRRRRGAALVGAADALRDAIATPRQPDEERWYARTLVTLQTDLGAKFDALYEHGKLLPLADALELADAAPLNPPAPVSARARRFSLEGRSARP